MNISEIDRNFLVAPSFEGKDLVFYDVDEAPFRVYGVQRENGCYRRIPEQLARSVSNGVTRLHTCTAGGRVRFVTDSPYIAIRAELHNVGKMSHIPFTGSVGLDLYREKQYIGTFRPPFDVTDVLDDVISTHCPTNAEYTINFPLYSGMTRLFVGVKKGSSLMRAKDYVSERPIVFYGSSITQGGCASRAGNAYTSIVSRRLGYDHINLGFSGSAKGEDAMADHVASLNAALFVYDYDHNAPNVEHLAKTHERFFLRVREQCPTLPVLMMTRPKFYLNDEEKQRLEIVRSTYENARARGDQNVYFLPGPSLISEWVREEALVDNCHPNDAGFASMAMAVERAIREILAL